MRHSPVSSCGRSAAFFVTFGLAASALSHGAQVGCEPDWVPGFGGLAGPTPWVLALEVFDDGAGAKLYAGGDFTLADGAGVGRVARWDGATWTPVGGGMDATVHALAVFDDGGGARLYAGGWFQTADGFAANHVARWDGAAWSPVGDGMDGVVRAFTEFDAGGGTVLVAGGLFSNAGASAASSVATWDGVSWAPLGGGIDIDVAALTTFDDGGGNALYAGGLFTRAGGVTVQNVAKWDGVAWSALGGGLDDTVRALASFDDGSGPALFAAGFFFHADGAPANNVARWDGSSWSAVGGGMDFSVRALEVYDDGSGGGPALFAGGSFLFTDGMSALNFAKWDGAGWSALPVPPGVGITVPVGAAFAVFDDGTGDGPALFAGGTGAPVSLGKWQGCPVDPGVPHAIVPYGSGLNPAGSLVVTDGTPTVGGAFTLGASNTADPASPAAFAWLTIAPAPAPFFPAGVPLAGWGMVAGAPGELLVALDGTWLLLGPQPWAGGGTPPASFALHVPAASALVGVTLYTQAVLSFPAEAFRLGLTNGLALTLGSAAP